MADMNCSSMFHTKKEQKETGIKRHRSYDGEVRCVAELRVVEGRS